MSTTTGARTARFVSSVVLLLACVVGVPWALTIAARARFDGPAPWHGVPAPGTWTWGAVRRALTEQLTEDTIADVVIRACLSVAWAGVVVLTVTVVAEVTHMVRHDGLPLPAVRGLWGPQAVARVIATGLLVVLPLLTSPSRAIAREGASLASVAAVSEPDADARGVEGVGDAAAQARSGSTAAGGPRVGAGTSPTAVGSGATYVVRAGDSVFGIAERLAGPDPAAVAACAERLLDLNLGREMPDGRRFTNAAYLDVGWVLDLPSGSVTAPPDTVASPSDTHVVTRGETLWSIADDELGDPARWPEIYEANRGRTFDDGRTLADPSLIQPGWPLDLPVPRPPETTPEPGTAREPTAADPAEATTSEPEPEPEPVAVAVPDPGPAAEAATVSPAGHDHGSVPTAEATVIDDARPRPSNRWIGTPPATPVPPASSSVHRPAAGADLRPDEPQPARSDVPLLTLGSAAMLSAGTLALLAVRRRSQLRQARPRARLPEPRPAIARTERSLRAIEPGDRFLRVDLAVRAAAMALVTADRRVLAVVAAADGSLDLRSSGPVRLDAPWVPTDDPCRHELPAAVPVELLATPARRVGAPCPTLVQLGRTLDEGDLYVDLEALEALEIGGPGHAADAIVTALAATLATSVLAEVTTLVAVGVPDAAFLGHRHHVPARDATAAFAQAVRAVGSTAASVRSTFELRARATGGETWEPAVVLLGAAVGTVTPPVDRTGLALVSASPIHGPSSRLEPDGDAWMLRPLGVRCVPIGLDAGELAALAGLVGSADAVLTAEPSVPSLAVSTGVRGPVVDVAPDDDLTLAPIADDSGESVREADDSGEPVRESVGVEPDTEIAAVDDVDDVDDRTPPAVLVRLLGPVRVRAADGREATFEKSKSKELIAWLATHRERATRAAARTALWELDVRDATFANVVSEARRSLARLVAPPDGEEWVGRTLTEALPLHDRVRTDADLLREALAAARSQPPAQAIATLRPAVDLVVGTPFEGTGYLWPDAEGIASQLVLLATTASAELATQCLSMGDIDGVFDATARGLQVLPGHEELIGLRMRAHAAAGDHAGVRLEWEQYERIVNADPWSDGEPSPTLVELRRHLLTR
jgi:LysM repeat protein/DNA-binding SARP family transcriptional activator